MHKHFKLSLLVAVFLAFITTSCTQKKSEYSMHCVAFYNLENLFDTINQEGVTDEEFIPAGKKKWTSDRYLEKLDNMARVIDHALFVILYLCNIFLCECIYCSSDLLHHLAIFRAKGLKIGLNTFYQNTGSILQVFKSLNIHLGKNKVFNSFQLFLKLFVKHRDHDLVQRLPYPDI